MLGDIGLFGACRSGGACAPNCGAAAAALAEEENAMVLAAQPAVLMGPFCGEDEEERIPREAAAPSSAATAKTRRTGRLQECICGEGSPTERIGMQSEEKAAPIIHEAMSTFVRTLVRGICIEVLLDDGSVIFPHTSLNAEMTHLTLDVNEAQRAIPLNDVESVATARELRTKNILTSIQPYLCDRCATLVLRGFEFVTFRLDNERHREYFAACLALLIARRDGESGAPKAAPAGLGQAQCLTVPPAMPADAGAGAHPCAMAAGGATLLMGKVA